MEVEFINKEQDWANETTRYWFAVTENTLDGCLPHGSYCIADCNGETTLLDRDGFPLHREDDPMMQGNSSDRKIYNALINERENHV